MPDQADSPRADRSTSRAHFHAKLSRYRSLLNKKWWVLVLGAVAGVAIQMAIDRSGKPEFISAGRMIVSIKLNIAEGSMYTEELSNFLGTQAALMQSGAVVSRAHARVVAQKPELKPQPVALRVSVLPKTTIFVLHTTGPDPEYVRAFLQACMDEYVALKKDMREQTSDTTLAGLTSEVMQLEKELRKADQEMAVFQSTNSVVVSQDTGNTAANYLATLNQRLAGLKSEYNLLQMLTLDQSLNRQQGTDGSLTLGSSSTNDTSAVGLERTDSEYYKAKQQLLLLQADQRELGRYLRTNHPKMVAMSEEIARREQLLQIFRMQGAELIESKKAAMAAELEQKKAAMAMEILNLERDVKQWDTKTLEIQGKTAEYQRLKGNSQRIQALYDRLLATMQTLDVNKQISPESVTIMEPASRAARDKSDLLKRAGTGGGVGLALGVLLLLFLDRLDDRMISFTELKEAFDEEVVGQVPYQRASRGVRNVPLIGPEDERHSFVEAYRNLRSSLLYMAEAAERPKVLLVTSSVPNEGKSLTAANLAITMASSGARVLLVDADSRKGALHTRFETPQKPGLTDVLAQGLSWEELTHATKFPNLFLLPQGTFAANASELFISDATKRFLLEARAKFDYVILDSVPVMAADDVTSLAPHADGVLFLIRAEFTSARVAHAALHSLYQRQARLLGLVFNSARPRFEDYYYYRYRDYYYRKYPATPAKPRAIEHGG